MAELDDHLLLAEFARSRSDTAFATLVRRYVNLVYSTAHRYTNNRQYAEEITQAVFIILARKAGRLGRQTVLPGWLYQAARLTSANFVRGEFRRERHEKEASMQPTLNESEAAAWEEIAPLLDEAMGNLNATDRATVVLRYFENKTAREIAAALNISEGAAHKRVNRSVEKLRSFFAKRGIHSSEAIIGAAISANSVHVAPAGLAETVSIAAAKGAAAAGSSTFALVKGALKVMAWTQAKTAVSVGVAILFAATATTVTVVKIHESHAEAWQLEELGFKILENPPFRTAVLPTKYYLRSKERGIGGLSRDAAGRACGVNQSISEMMRAAYSEYGSAIGPARTILQVPESTNRYDFIANFPNAPREALQKELKRKLGLIGSVQAIETNVLILKVKNPNSRSLKLHPFKVGFPGGLNTQNSLITGKSQDIDGLARALEESFFNVPILNQTGLAGQYDFALDWDSTGETRPDGTKSEPPNLDGLKRALIEQLGLELVPATAPVQMLVIASSR